MEDLTTTGKMRRTVALPIDIIFATNDTLASQALADLTAEQVWKRPIDRNNPMLWVAGHLVQTRTQLLGLLGDPFDTGWGDRSVRGATVGDPDSYPTREEVERTMREVSDRFHAKRLALDDAQLAQPSSEAPGASTVAHQIAGFAFHDSYHVGQMGSSGRRLVIMRLPDETHHR